MPIVSVIIKSIEMKRINLLVFVLVLTISGCTGARVNERLSVADSLMMQSPDSSLSILEHIDTTLLHTAKQKARFSLLHTMAIDRTGIDTTDIRLIQPAFNYYQRYGSFEDKAKTFFYYGRVQYNNADYTASIVSFLDAFEHAERIDNNWLKGMICSYIGLTYNQNYNSKDELSFAQKSYDYFIEYGDSLYIDHELLYLAAAYHNNHDFDKADSLYCLADSLGRNAKFAYLMRAENEITRDAPRPKDAVVYFENAYKKGAVFSLSNWYQYCYALLLSGNDGAADKLIGQLDSRSADVKSLWWKYRIARQQGDTVKALRLFESFDEENNLKVRELLKQSLYKAQVEHTAKVSSELKFKTNRLAIILVFSALLLFLTSAVSFLMMQRSKREKDLLSYQLSETQNLLELAKTKEEDFKESDDSLKKLQVSFVSMYKQQFARIGHYYNTRLDLSLLMDDAAKQYAETVSEIMSEISDDDGKQGRFENRINNEFDNVIDKLRSDFPEFTEKDFKFLSLVIAGFKGTTIAAILGEKPTNVSTRKARLKTRVFSKSTANTPLYKLLIV